MSDAASDIASPNIAFLACAIIKIMRNKKFSVSKSPSSLLATRFQLLNSSSGFTLVELLIFLGMFAALSAAFITVLLTVTRVQVRQASVVEVGEQSQFLLQQIQYYIEKSSLIDIPQDTPTSTLKLWTGVPPWRTLELFI